MASTIRLEDQAVVINRIMASHQLTTKDVYKEDKKRNTKKKQKFQVVFAYGHFECSFCPNYGWNSRYSWARINLFDQMIDYKWSMKCIRCRSLEKPTFSQEEFEKLVQKAVCLYLGRDWRDLPHYGNGDKSEGYDKRSRWPRQDPHYPELCEKCDWGSTRCWLKGCYQELR